jgi:hypothetical protein
MSFGAKFKKRSIYWSHLHLAARDSLTAVDTGLTLTSSCRAQQNESLRSGPNT